MADFGWTGAPGTCLWCGGRLRIAIAYTEASDNLRKAVLDHLGDRRPRYVTIPEIGRCRVWISGGQVDVASGVRVGHLGKARAREDGEPGTHAHDGKFCCAGCAERFGIAAARDGVRFQTHTRTTETKT